MKTFKRPRHLERVGLYFAVGIVLVAMLFPFYWMVVASLKPFAEFMNFKSAPLWVAHPTLENYQTLLTTTPYLQWFSNSVFVTVTTTIISLTLSVLAGYAVAMFRFRGADLITTLILVSYLVPRTMLFIPMTQIVNGLGLSDSLWAMVITYPTFLVPFGTWLLAGFFRALPPDLEECARIDGGNRFQAMIHIMLPLALPGIISAGIFDFTLAWAEFLYGSAFVSSDMLRTLPAGVIVGLVRGDVFNWGPLMAAALLGSVPVALVYSLFVNQYVSGLTAGAVKG